LPEQPLGNVTAGIAQPDPVGRRHESLLAAASDAAHPSSHTTALGIHRFLPAALVGTAAFMATLLVAMT
jgi:hypothetical protein